MDLGIRGRTAIVTGGSQGLGLAIAAGLAAEGANLVLNARDPERLQAAATELESSSGVRVVAVAGDVRDEDLPARLVQAAREEQGRLDILVTNVTRPGLIGFIKSLSVEVAADGVLCNAVAPGWTATPPVSSWLEQDEASGRSAAEKHAALLSEIPMGRIAEPAEIADAVVYLASERASYVTGQTLTVDGGYVKGLL